MEVRLLKGLTGCNKAQGVVVIIDVFRATTTLACLLASQPRELYVAASYNSVSEIISAPDVACFSEISHPNRLHDNSPLSALSLNLKKKRAILISQNGTVALEAVQHCNKTIACAFINFDAVVEHLRLTNPELVSIVAIGHINRAEETVEDNICAEYLYASLLGKEFDVKYLRQELFKRVQKRRLDPESPQGKSVDIDIMLSCCIGTLNVVPMARYDGYVTTITDALSLD